MYLTDLAIRIRISNVSCGGKEICFHTILISTKHCAHKKPIKKSILPSDRFARLFNSDLKILHMHACITYHNWLAEILVHCCPPQGREVYTVEGGLVPEGTGRSVDSHF